MTILDIIPGAETAASTVRRGVRSLAARAGRLLNRWAAAAIARRAHAANLAVLRRFGERELKHIGLTRGDLDSGLEEAAKRRMRKEG